MCQEPVVQCTCFQKIVKARHKIDMMFANASKQIVGLTFVRAYVKIRRKIDVCFVNMQKHVATLSFLFTNKCSILRAGFRKVPGASRLRFSYISEKIVQQYRTSAFGPSKTRRTIDILFVNMSKHVVKLTLFLPMCHNTPQNSHCCCQIVKTRSRIDIIFANV